MSPKDRALELGHNPGIVDDILQFKQSFIQYDSDNTAELFAIFFGANILWSPDGRKELKHQAEERDLSLNFT